MKRILVIGLQGSGKSTFANRLGNMLNQEVTHLDKLYYKPGWKPVASDAWRKIVNDLISRKEWIIDGNYQSTLDTRLIPADTVIFFDFNKFLCLCRMFSRSMKKDQPFDKAEGNINKLSWDLIKKMILYPRKKVLRKLKGYKDTKKIIVFKNDKEAENFLRLLKL